MRGVLLSLCLAAGWAATAAGARVRTVSQGVGEPGVPPPQQGGHTNPYCLTCRQIFNQWNENQEMSLDDICGAFPEGKVQQCRVVGKALHGNRDVKTLLNNGCLDKTKKLSFNEVNATYYSMGAEDPRMRAGGECPGVLACNIIESVAGGPMCGSRLRAWGDFLKEDSLERPIRPSPYDTFPQEDGPPMSNPLPWYTAYFGDPKCDLCIDIMLALNREKESRGEDTCRFEPFSMKKECMKQVDTMRRNYDARKIVLEGCVDSTSLAPIERPSGKCAPEVACNAIARTDSGAPYCGARLREFGDFVAGGDSADQEIRNYYMGGAPLMSDSPFYPEGGASYPTAEFRRL